MLSLILSSSRWTDPPRAQFSDCGRFVVITPWPHFHSFYVIHKLDAEPVTTRYHTISYWSPDPWLTPSGEHVIRFETLDQTSYRLVSRKLLNCDPCEEKHDTRSESVHLDNVICYPSSMSDSDRFMLLGENDDEEMRLLIAPHEGRALEIRPLSLSFNEAKRRLEIEWEKRRALRDEDTRGTEE